MFDIGFSELLLVAVIGLVVLGPERLPVAVRTVAGWIRAMRSLATNVQNELNQELKLQELQQSLKKVEEKVGLETLSPELKESMDELRQAAQSLKKEYDSSTNSVEDGLNKAKEVIEQVESDTKKASLPAEETKGSDPDIAAKRAAVLEASQATKNANTDSDTSNTNVTIDVKKSSHQTHSEP